jgi:hypothetical protein
MRTGSLFVLAATALAAPAPAPSGPATFFDITVPSEPSEALRLLQWLGEASFKQAKEEVSERLTNKGAAPGCTVGELQIRREW